MNLVAVNDSLRLDPTLRGQDLVVIFAEVNVLETFRDVIIVDPLHSERRLDGFVETDARATIGADVNARQTFSHSEIKRGAVDTVFRRRQRTGHVRDIIRNENDFTSFRILCCRQLDAPANHANFVQPWRTIAANERSRPWVKDELHEIDDVAYARVDFGKDIRKYFWNVVYVRRGQVLARHSLALNLVQQRVHVTRGAIQRLRDFKS